MYNLVMLLQKFQTFVLSKMAKGEKPSFLKLNGPVLMNFFKFAIMNLNHKHLPT